MVFEHLCSPVEALHLIFILMLVPYSRSPALRCAACMAYSGFQPLALRVSTPVCRRSLLLMVDEPLLLIVCWGLEPAAELSPGT